MSRESINCFPMIARLTGERRAHLFLDEAPFRALHGLLKREVRSLVIHAPSAAGPVSHTAAAPEGEALTQIFKAMDDVIRSLESTPRAGQPQRT